MPRTQSARPRSFGAAPLALVAAGSVFLLTFVLGIAPAWADCPADPSCVGQTIDTTGQTVGQTVDTVGQSVDPVGQTAGQTVDTVEQTANQTVNSVGQTAGQMVDTITHAVNSVPSPLVGPGPASTGGGSSSEPHIGSAEAGSRPAASNQPQHRPVVPPPARVPRGIPVPPQVGLSAGAGDPAPSLSSTSGLARLVPALAFPMLLLAVVMLFVAVQNRIDRRDPRLANASLLPEVVGFE